MTEKSSNELLITEVESLVLEAIAQSIVPYSQRAQALLAVDAGSSLDQAAGVAGLKGTQVRYWVGRFRNSRLLVFPEALLKDIEELISERKTKSKATKNKSDKSGKTKSKKATSGSGNKDKKKLKAAKKKKAGKSKEKKKTKGKKAVPAKGKKEKKKKAVKKKK